jgi:hypothetical protein
MTPHTETRVPCSRKTRDEILHPLKRGGETYDELLQRIAKQYNPNEEDQTTRVTNRSQDG